MRLTVLIVAVQHIDRLVRPEGVLGHPHSPLTDADDLRKNLRGNDCVSGVWPNSSRHDYRFTVHAPEPTNESLRLRLLRRHRILDTPPEPVFDDLARLASVICATPIALVVLVDSDRQWFKARVGLDDRETPREYSFCAHAILEDDVMVVGDALEDPRFSANPLVSGNPNIRFYAGAPLVTSEGAALGTLCVIDRVPRSLTDEQLSALRVLRRAVVTQMEWRRALQDLTDIETLVPMCAWCRGIRDESGQWVSLFEFVAKSADVTHGICPNCVDKLERDL